MYVLLAVALFRPIAFLVVAIASLVRGNPMDEDVMTIFAMAAGAVAVGWFWLLLIRKARRGRRWAWLTLIGLLGLIAVVGALVMTAVYDGAAVGLVMMVVPIVLIGLLAGSRRSREYFARPHVHAD